MTTFYNHKIDGLDESSRSTRFGTPQLTGYEENIIPRGMQSNTRYEGVPDCPVDIDTIEYVEKKHGRTIKNLPREIQDVLKEDELYGKKTLVTNRMMKPYISGKVNKGEITLAQANDNPNNFIYWNTVYKGLRWERLLYICGKWGVKLVKLE